MLLDLLVLKFEYLQAVRVSGLSCFGFSEIVHNTLVGVGLFYVFISKVDYQVPVWVGFSSNTIGEYDFFLSRLVDALNLPVMTHNLINYLLVFTRFLVVLVKVLQAVIFFKLVGDL
jgi:hypothetical protein